MNMNWVRAIIGILVLWSGTAWGATLTWTANSDTDLAGYRVYRCTVSDCTRTSGNASLLATLGTVTSFNIGTPSVTTYYFVTAFDSANNESSESTLVAYSPPSSVPPAIGVSPTSFAFAATQGGANPTSQTLNITNTGGGTLSWTASDNATWLTLSRTSGSGNASVTLSATTGTLAAGTYYGTIAISATGAASVTVPVTFTVASASVPVIGASPTSFAFTATQGGANPATQNLRITNTGGGTLNWTASDNATWLTLSRTSGSGYADVTLSVATGTLAAGTYNGTITISATGASSVTLPVTFTITSGSSVEPAVGVSPTSLSFTARRGTNPTSQTLRISNTGGGTLYWTVSDTATWLSTSPSDGVQNGTVTVSVTTGSLLAGTYTAELRVWKYNSSTPVRVPVTFTVTP